MPEKITDIETWEDMLTYLQTLTPEQLRQRAQIAKPTPMPMVELQIALAMGTVADMGFWGCRSSVNNRYNGDEVVMLTDYNPWGEDGAIAYEMTLDDPDGESILSKENPIYGKDGKTPYIEQIAPEHHLAYQIEIKSIEKDKCISNAEYDMAAKLRDEIEEMKKRLPPNQTGDIEDEIEAPHNVQIIKNRMKHE